MGGLRQEPDFRAERELTDTKESYQIVNFYRNWVADTKPSGSAIADQIVVHLYGRL